MSDDSNTDAGVTSPAATCSVEVARLIENWECAPCQWVDQYAVTLRVGNQTFRLAPARDDRPSAEWMADRLREALEKAGTLLSPNAKSDRMTATPDA